MRKIIIAIFATIFISSCGPTKFQQENIKYQITTADGNSVYVVGEVKKLPGGCISYQHGECGSCGVDETSTLVTSTVCGTYKITKIR